MNNNRKIRILHSVGSLNRGGIETWLTNVVRQRHPELQMDFLLGSQRGESGDYEREVAAIGSRLFYRPPITRANRRLAALGLASIPPVLVEILRRERYDVLHVHGEELNGDTVREAHSAGTPVRVAHCHHTQIARGKSGPEMCLRKLRYVTIDRAWTLRHATDMVACGRDAGRLMVGERWATDPRCKVIYCGVPLSAVKEASIQSSRADLLARYGFPSDAKVIGHAGSMGPTPVKNHALLVQIFAELTRRDARYRLVMAGGGPLRGQIEQQVKELGLVDKVRIPGVIPDVAAHMVHLFDVHLLPSLAEGLPVVAIEAAAAGLFTVMADTVTEEFGEILPGRSERVKLDSPLAHWADRVEAGMLFREPVEDGIRRVRASPFSIESSTESLHKLYSGRLAALQFKHNA